MIIGERTAEEIKISIATARSKDDSELFEVRGRNLINGLPMHVFVTSADISQALDKPLSQIVEAVHNVLEQTPPELAADLFERGAIMTGGTSLISGLDKRIQEKIGIKVIVAEGPVTAVVRGTGKSLDWLDRLDSSEMGEESNRKKAIMERMKNNFN